MNRITVSINPIMQVTGFKAFGLSATAENIKFYAALSYGNIVEFARALKEKFDLSDGQTCQLADLAEAQDLVRLMRQIYSEAQETFSGNLSMLTRLLNLEYDKEKKIVFQPRTGGNLTFQGPTTLTIFIFDEIRRLSHYID